MNRRRGRCRGVRALTVLLVAIAPRAQIAQPPLAVDHNPDPRVFETVITATERTIELVPGLQTTAMTFNGTVPGPTIEAAVGDTLVVHFVNMLSEESVLHWHGVATPASMDGSEISQGRVPRSGYHRYEFTLNAAGTFWYHPHLNTNEQVEKGLYGALIVRDRRLDDGLGVATGDERVLFLDDVKLTEDGGFAPFATDLGADFEPWQRAEDLANSRVGDHVLINGRALAGDSVPTLTVRSGVPYRLRLLNASSGRVFRLDASDVRIRLWAVGSDQGLWNVAEPVRPIGQIKNPQGHHQELISDPDDHLGVTLTPADRAEVVLVVDGAGDEGLAIRSHDFIKGKHIAYRDPEGRLLFGHDHFDGAEPARDLIRLRVVGPPSSAQWQPPPALRPDPIVKLEPDAELPSLPVFFGHSPPSAVDGNVMFFLRVEKAAELLHAVRAREPVLPADYAPLPMMKQRADDGYRVRVGEVRVWEVVNFTGNDHNFHVHGFRFQHVDTCYVDLDGETGERTEPPLRLAWEDTIRIPKRPGLALGRSYSIVRLAARFDDTDLPAGLRRSTAELLAGGLSPSATSSGGWVVHCHFLEHGARGMMSFLEVSR